MFTGSPKSIHNKKKDEKEHRNLVEGGEKRE